MTSTPLAEAASQFTLEDVVAHGQRQGRTPEQIATAVKRWRDGAREFGEAKLKESDPLKWFRGNAKLDSRIRDELDGVKVIAATEMIASTIRNETDRSEFVRQYEAFNGDPSKFAEGSGARSLAEKLQGIDRSDAFNLPDASDRVAPLATEAGVMLGDFETQARPGDGGLDILIRLDDKDEGSKRKSITIPEVTDEDIASARSKAEDEVKRLRQVERATRRALEDDLAEEPVQRGYDLGYQADLKNRKGIGEREIETARIEAEAAEARASSLADPDRGRLVLLRERVEEEIKSDKDLKEIAGDVALGEDFWRGVQQTHLGARLAIADAKGEEEEKTKLRGLIGELGQIYPGSTNYQFRGGAGAFVSDVSSVMGGMLPTMLVSSVTGGVGAATGSAVGGVTRAAALAPISLSAYGNAYATMLNEADSLDQQGRVEEAEQRRRDARTYAMLSAAVETGSEFIFKEEMFRVGGRGLLQKVARGAAQNTAEEFVASVGNAELNREFLDELTPVSQIVYESALGTAVGGLMQVPGGVVEVFLPKAKPTPQAPPPAEEPTTGETSTPPPSSPPPTGESTPPPSEGAVFKIGEQMFTWSGSEWTNQATGQAVDPQTDPGLALQLGEARRQLEAGETPVPQEVNLTPDETPTIFTIDGQRSFMPAPDGKGWLEVFPQTGEESRPANFASEGEIGIAILRRLQAKMAEKQAAAALPPAQDPPAEETPAEETPAADPTPGVDDRPADGVVSSGKPKGAKARFRWRIVSRADLEAMVIRDIEEAQTRQRKGNVASDEQRERMATGLDPDLVMESPVSSMGAPAVFEGKVLAGNGRADGISEAYRRGLAGDYETRIREFAAERRLEVPDEPILIREIVDFTQGDARSFVVESNPKRGGMLAESVSEQALLDSETIGDDVLANLTFTADGNLTSGSLAAVATQLEEANRGITRTLSGQFDRAEAGRRVMAAFLSRLISRAGRDASDVASILETDGGKRAVAAIAQAAPRLSKLDDDLSLATPIVESLLEFKSGLSAVSKGEFANMTDWLENRTNELLASSLDPVSREVLSEMAGSVSSGAAIREFIDDYLEEAEAEQKERDNANSTGDIFGDERTSRTAEDIFRKLGRIAGPQASVGTGIGAADARETGREAEGRPARSAPEVGPEAEGQLLPESELPFNLAGEVITEAEPVIPEDTRTDAEKDADSGQERLFDDRITPLAPGKRTGVAEADTILEDLLRRFPEKSPRQSAQRDDAAQARVSDVQGEVRKYFGGDVPSGVRVVWEPGAVWDASFNRDLGTIELNAALLRPGETAFKIDHEVGHVLFQDAEFAAAFEALWNALPKLQQDRISNRVGKAIEKGYYDSGDAFEETRVRALEAIRRMAVGDHADAGVKRAWRKFLTALSRAWKRITGREPVDPERLAAAMIEIGVVRMRSGTGGGEGVALSTIDFEGFKAWALEGIEPDGFIQEDAGRLWVAADVEGNVNMLFGNFADADEYFRTMSHKGEFLWDVTESYERMVGGIPLRKPDGPITPEDAARRYYPVDPAPGETPAEAGNLPRVSPTGQPVTSALLPDMGLRYGLTEFKDGRVQDFAELRKLPDPNRPHRNGGRVFSVSDSDEFFRESLSQFQFGKHDPRSVPSFPAASRPLRAVGINALNITLPYSVISEKISKHGIPIFKMMRLPEAVRDPIAIFDSETQAGARLILTELRHKEESLAVAIHIDTAGEVAEVRSIHNRPARQFVNFIENGRTLYYHQEKIRNWLSHGQTGVQFPPAWVQLRRTKGIVSDSDLQGEIFSLSDGIGRQQSRDAQSLANLESTFRVSFFAGDFDGATAAIEGADYSAIEAFVKKHVRLAQAGNLDAAEILEWVKHINANTRPETVDAEIEELLRAKRARFPGRRSSGMRDILDQYYTAESFERAFAKHVADGDFQKAYEAVRDSDDSVTIPTLKKWMKAVRTGDPVAQKNLEWIRAIFNGTIPPGVSQQPPPTGPAPSSGTATPPPQQQAPPPPPPPAAPKSPPRPDGVEKLNIPALVFLARKMGTTPLVRKFRARGSFRPSNNRGEPQESPIIRVNEFLGKEDWQGAARTLAHEIGHFIDYIVNAIPFADIVKRLIPLESVRDQFIEDIFGQGTKYSEARKYMMDEAIALSKIMRGDFDDNDAYRKSSVELYADFMSAVMIDPELAFDTAPLMSHAWFAHLDQKPTALAAWNLVQNLIKGDGLFEAIRQDRVEDQTAAMSNVGARSDRIARRDRWWNKIGTTFVGAVWSRYVPAGAKKVTAPGWKNHFRFTARWWEAATNPKEGDFVAKMEGAEIEASQRGSALRLRMQRDVYDPLRRHGISNVQLDEYLTFFQILNEDTATRQYLQENPEEFREFLLWLDDAAGLGRASEIEGASDADLDLIGAGMVGTIQLHEQLEMIYSMAQSADAPDIAARGLFAFDIARYQWNQEGHTPETAQQGMDYLQRELGDERFDVLRAASRAFHQNLAGIVREANSVGLFGDRIWAEKIKPNIGNYVPRMVLDYFTGEMSASIKQRRGSVKGTLPKYLAGEGQAMVLLHKIAKQKQVLFILEQASDFGWSNEIQPLTIPRSKNPDTVAKQLRKEEGKAIRGYYVRGKWSWLSFDDPAVVEWLDGADAGALKPALDIAKANENTWRLWTTVLKASFALYNNPVRTIKTGLSDFGYRSPQWAAHAVRQVPEALAWARASLGMEAPTERVLDLVERGVLPAFGQYSAADLRISNEDLVAQIAEGLTGIEALRRGRIAQDPVSRAVQNALNAPGVRQLVRWLSLFTGTFEALPKLATDSFWESRGLPEWERDRLSRMEGIPNTGLSAGKFGSWAGTVSLFYRVWVQGMRRMMTLPVNPRTRGMWWTGRLADFAMKGFYAAAAAGIIDALLGGDDEEKQVDWQEAFTRVSNFKLTNGDVLFFGWTLPDGSYEPPWGHSMIPSNWTPLLLRLPVSESGRISEPLAMMTIGRLFPDNPLAPSTPGDKARRLRDLRASLSPSLNPIFENAWYALSLGDPKSPRDPYSGRDVVPQDEWDSGMNARRWGIAKHLLEDTPLGNFSPALRSGIQNEKELPTWLRAVSSIPGASAALATDNSQLAADYMDRIEERDSVNRKARLLRGPKTKAAVSLRSRLSRIPAESRTPAEQEKIEILNHWYRTAYMGNSTYPGLYRELQAHAAGMEGVDEKGARDALEGTAAVVLREIGEIRR